MSEARCPVGETASSLAFVVPIDCVATISKAGVMRVRGRSNELNEFRWCIAIQTREYDYKFRVKCAVVIGEQGEFVERVSIGI